MAERKTSVNTSTQSKGAAGQFAKQVQRTFSRAQEKVLQRFGKSEETRDEQFEICVQNFQDQQSDGNRIYKDLKAYLNAVKVMRDASSRLFQSLYDSYDMEWEGGEELGAVVEGEDLLWNDYESKLRDQAVLTLESYMSQFPDIREKVAKRGRKLVDYDSSRHQLEALQNAKKRDDVKITKAEEELKTAKTIFEDMNRELKVELPALFDSRIGCYITVFQAVTNLKDIFYKEMAKNNQDFQNVIMDLKAQYPDQSFVLKNFNRGTLKRRSLKNMLSPRSLMSGFSDFHMSYSPRGSLRRDHSSSFRSDRGSYIPEVTPSPVRPKPIRDINRDVKDTGASPTSEDNPKVTDDPETSGSAHNATTEDTKQEDTKEGEPVPITEQYGEKEDPKSISSPETENENELDLKVNHSEGGDASSCAEVPQGVSAPAEESKQPSCGGLQNGIATDSKAEIEGSETSSKVTIEKDHTSDNLVEE